MKQTGIIMSGDHPKKVLNGTKTLTRRTYGLEKINKNPDDWVSMGQALGIFSFLHNTGMITEDIITLKCPYGGVGDKLIMKETWATENRYNHLKPSQIPQRRSILYYLAGIDYDPFTMGIKRPSIFMPRWASRADLEITGLRAERLQRITEEDAIREGCISNAVMVKEEGGLDYTGLYARDRFVGLWDSLNAKEYSWESNPWVWVIEFKLIDGGN